MTIRPPAESALQRKLPRSARRPAGALSTSSRFRTAHGSFAAAVPAGAWIFALAVAVRLVFILSVPAAPLETDARDYDALGWQLAQGKGYVGSAGEPTAYRPPVYPALIGLVYLVAGHDPAGVRWVQAFLGAWTCVLVFRLSQDVFKRGALAGVVAAVYPPLVVGTAEILTETLFAFLLLAAVYLVISRNGTGWQIASGITLGLAILTRPIAVFFLPFLGCWMLARADRKALAVVAIGLALVMAPWAVRNYARLGAFVPFANVGGLTLYNSYVIPAAGFGYNSLEGVGADYFQIDSETDRSRYLVERTVRFVSQNPLYAVKLGVLKLVHLVYPFDGYWSAVSFGSKYNVFWGLVLSFALFGGLIGTGRAGSAEQLLCLLLLSFLLGAAVFYGSPRFRLPLEPILISFAAAGMHRLWVGRHRTAGLIFLVNLLLFFLFRHFEMREVFRFAKMWL